MSFLGVALVLTFTDEVGPIDLAYAAVTLGLLGALIVAMIGSRESGTERASHGR